MQYILISLSVCCLSSAHFTMRRRYYKLENFISQNMSKSTFAKNDVSCCCWCSARGLFEVDPGIVDLAIINTSKAGLVAYGGDATLVHFPQFESFPKRIEQLPASLCRCAFRYSETLFIAQKTIKRRKFAAPGFSWWPRDRRLTSVKEPLL